MLIILVTTVPDYLRFFKLTLLPQGLESHSSHWDLCLADPLSCTSFHLWWVIGQVLHQLEGISSSLEHYDNLYCSHLTYLLLCLAYLTLEFLILLRSWNVSNTLTLPPGSCIVLHPCKYWVDDYSLMQKGKQVQNKYCLNELKNFKFCIN